ncbi:DUF1127 domain-containing protein [Sinorhizobium garamanticum]|uniref:DUF1127 domain-containing protein n=1 Tax=Sinorhizobium garamanticum TaxID=680247 RepID=A0ABY8D9L6_9HYPH|nr:DUF1127 domain-containing protein [Sinorhizobium garamanticum]WEX86992.1 DUF1127 domain-containing protein [Sinorhizobium garamanticum]
MNTIDTIHLSPWREIAAREARFGYGLQRPQRNVLSRLWHLYCTLAAKRRSRLALEELSPHLLKDIGLTETEARREAAVPFWR